MNVRIKNFHTKLDDAAKSWRAISVLVISLLSWGSAASEAGPLSPTISYVLEEVCIQPSVKQEGVIPLLILSSHGADLSKQVPSIPLRAGVGIPNFRNKSDQHTAEITWAIADQIEQDLGLKPFVITLDIHRSQLDANRPPEQAFEHPAMQVCYQEYHQLVRAYLKRIKALTVNGHGLLLDIHGHATKDIEDTLIRGTQNGSTLTSLIERLGSEYYNGDSGLFSLLSGQGYDTLPVGDDPETLLAGGFTVQSYSSNVDQGVDAIQIEIGKELRNTPQKRADLASDLADSISDYLQSIGLL